MDRVEKIEGSIMDRDEIEKLRELAQKATPGPWEFYYGRDCGWTVQNCPTVPSSRLTPEPTTVTDVLTDGDENDARFVAAANPDTVLRLLAALDSARDDGFRSGIEAVAKIAHECPYATLRELIGMARNLTPPTDPGAGCKVCGAFSPGSECNNNPCSCRCHFDQGAGK